MAQHCGQDPTKDESIQCNRYYIPHLPQHMYAYLSSARLLLLLLVTVMLTGTLPLCMLLGSALCHLPMSGSLQDHLLCDHFAEPGKIHLQTDIHSSII